MKKAMIFAVFVGLFIVFLGNNRSKTIAQSTEQLISDIALEKFGHNDDLSQMYYMNNEISNSEISYSSYEVTLVENHDDWARVHIVSEPSSIYDSNDKFHGILFQGAVARIVDGIWEVYFQGTEEFDDIKDDLPLWLSFLSSTPQATETITQFSVPALPTVIGDSKFSTLRFTHGPGSSHSPNFSIDLAVLNTEETPNTNFQLSVYAVDEGEVVRTLNSGTTCFSIVRPDGLAVWYQHVNILDELVAKPKNSGPNDSGSYVRMNDLIGVTTSTGSCGYSGTVSHHVHLTFFDHNNGNSLSNAINPIGSILNDWTLVNSDVFQRHDQNGYLVSAVESTLPHMNDQLNWMFHRGCPDIYSTADLQLFDAKNCTENSKNISSNDQKIILRNIGWNNRAASLKVAPGHAVLLWLGEDTNVEPVCYNGDKWDLSKDYHPNNLSVSFYKTISSIQVFEGICAQAPQSCVITIPSTNLSGEEELLSISGASCEELTPPPPDEAPPFSGPHSDNVAIIYSHPNFGGTKLFRGGVGFSNEPNNEGYSLDLPYGWSAITYRGDNATGLSRCWDGDVNNFQDHSDWQNKTQSIMVYDYNACSTDPPQAGDRVQLFDNINYQNRVNNVSVGFHDFLAHNAESLKVPNGWSVFVYQWDGRQVKEECFNRDIPNLDLVDNWDNKIYGMDVYDDDLSNSSYNAFVYNNLAFDGTYCQLPGTYGTGNLSDWCGGLDWNDRISSFRIKQGYSIKVWEHADFIGGTRCFSSGITSFRNHAFSDGNVIAVYPPGNGERDSRISSIKLYDNEHCDGSPDAPDSAWAYANDGGNLALGMFVMSTEANDDQSITVEWNQSSDAATDGYHVYEHVDNDQYELVATINSRYTTSWTHTSLPCGTDYQYLVKSFDDQWGDSHSPNLVSASTPSCFVAPIWGGDIYLPLVVKNYVSQPPPQEGPVPNAPTNLRMTGNPTQSQINVAWNDNSGIEEMHEVWYKPNGGTWLNPSVGVNVQSYSIVGLDCNTTYSVIIRSVNTTGGLYYSESNWIYPTTSECDPGEGPYPNPPTNVRAIDVTQNSITFAWDDNSGIETSYRLQVRDKLGVIAFDDTLPANTINQLVDSLECGTEYQANIQIRPITPEIWTESFYEHTDWCIPESSNPRSPTNFHVTGETQTTISYFWVDNSSYETEYRIYWFETAIGNPQTMVSFPVNSESGTITGLACGTRYTATAVAYINGIHRSFWRWHDTDPC